MIRKLITLSDENLLILLEKNDPGALEELYRRYWDQLYINAYKVLKSKSTCEDLVQEIFIDLWEKRRFDRIENLPAYLSRATRHKTLMALRKNHIRQKHLDVFEGLNSHQSENNPLRVKELREEIIIHLDHLPQKCREVFYKSRFEHITNQEIAEQMGISKRTVETHISHALKYLRGVKEFLMVIIAWWL